MSQPATTLQPGLHRTKPYESDGGFSAAGLLITTGAGVAVALVAGVLAAIVGQFFYAVFIYPMLIGCAVGGTQVFAIRHTKIRTPLACGAAGLIAGVVAITTMHYVDYGVFRQVMSERAGDERELQQALAAAADDQEREILSQLISSLQEDPDVAQAKRVDSFFAYLDWSARQGVELSSTRGSSTPLNLGYVGSYVYWGVEALIVALISAAMARGRAGEPFCLRCDTWMVQRELGSLRADPQAVAAIVESGRLSDLTDLAANPRDEAAISAYECPCCKDEAEVVLQIDTVRYDNGSRVKTKMARAVYPKLATEELARFFFSAEDAPLSRDIDPETVRKLQAAANAKDTGALVAAAKQRT